MGSAATNFNLKQFFKSRLLILDSLMSMNSKEIRSPTSKTVIVVPLRLKY